MNAASITAFVSVPSFSTTGTGEDGDDDDEEMGGGLHYMDSASEIMARWVCLQRKPLRPWAVARWLAV